MEPMLIHGKSDTPEVDMNENGQIEISGRSYPEDAVGFYSPIIKWLSELLQSKPSSVCCKLKLEYFNTSSSKQLFKLFSLLENHKYPCEISVLWYYNSDDRDMLSSGERFKKLVNIPIKLCVYTKAT